MDRNTLGLTDFFAPQNQAPASAPAKRQSALGLSDFERPATVDLGQILSQEGADALRPIIEAIYKQESGGGANARTSTNGAQGGMQVMPGTFQQYARAGERIDNPADNMRVGVRIIKDLANKFGGDPAKIAAGYFSGAGNVNPGDGPAWKADHADGNGKRVSGYVGDVLAHLGAAPASAVKESLAAQPALPDLAKAPAWADIVAKREFRALSPEQRAEAKAAYFDHWVAPHAGADAPLLREQFLAKQDAEPGVLTRIGDALGLSRNPGEGSNTGQLVEALDKTQPGAPKASASMPVDPQARAQLEAQWDAGSPEARARLQAQPGWIGVLARERAAQFAAADAKPLPVAQQFDTRAEARAARIAAQGDDPRFAERAAREGALRGVLPGREVAALTQGYGLAQPSNFDFDTKERFDPRQAGNGVNNALVRGATKGALGLGKAASGYMEAVSDLIGADKASALFKDAGQHLRGQEEAIGTRSDALSRNFEGAVSSIAQQLPLLLGGAAMASEAIPLAGIALTSFGQEYSDGKARGQTPGQASTRAALFAAFEVVGEKFGLGAQLQAIKGAARGMPGDQILGFLAEALRKEIPGELLTTTGQFATDKWAPKGVGLNPNATLEDYLAQVGDTIVQTVMQSGMMAGGTTGVAAGVRHLTQRPADPAPGLAARIEPTLDAAPAPVAPEVQTATDIVRELAQMAGVPESTVLPAFAEAPAAAPAVPVPHQESAAPAASTAAEEAVSDEDLLAYADTRRDQLREKRDGRRDTVMGEEGPVEVDIPGQGLTAGEQAELDALFKVGGDASALRQLYDMAAETEEAPQAGQPEQTGQAAPAALETITPPLEQDLGHQAPEAQQAEAQGPQAPTAAADPTAGLTEHPAQDQGGATPPVGTGAAQSMPAPVAPAGEATPVDTAAQAAATSPANTLPEPTQAQKEAGNYAKGHVRLAGLDLSIENPAGSTRRGVGRDGVPWENTLQHHYGYIRGTQGADKDHVDAFIKPGTPTDYTGPVFVVDQVHPDTGAFDEHKVLIGFASEAEAREAYAQNYAKGWAGLQAITPMDMGAFKAWVMDGPKKTPLAQGAETEAEREARLEREAIQAEASYQAPAEAGQDIPFDLAAAPATPEESSGVQEQAAAHAAPRTEKERNQQADYGDKWFSTLEKAQAFIQKKRIADTHEAVKVERGRVEIRGKGAQAAAAAAAPNEDEASSAWTRMTTSEREAVLLRAGESRWVGQDGRPSIFAVRLAELRWDRMGKSVREKISAALGAPAQAPSSAPVEVTSSKQPLSEGERTDLDGWMGHNGSIATKDMGGHWMAEATGNSLKTPVRAHGSTKDSAIRNLYGAVRDRQEQAAPGTRYNGEAERLAADRLQALHDAFQAERNTPAGQARADIRSVIEELRKPRTVVSVEAVLEAASAKLARKHGAQARVVDEVVEALGKPAASHQKAETADPQSMAQSQPEKESPGGVVVQPAAEAQNQPQNQGTENADPLQPDQLSRDGAPQDRGDAAPGNRDRQPVDAGLAQDGEGAAGDGRVPASIDGAGERGAPGAVGRDGPAPGEARDRGAVRAEPAATDAQRGDANVDFDLGGEDIGTGGLARKYKDNIAAIRILKAMDLEGRVATPEERKQLARYVGWGALKGVFDPANKQWAKQHAELHELLTEDEWKAARASTLNAHYTDKTTVGAMFDALDRLGFKRGRVLEPSVGSGNFFGLMPASMRNKSQLHAVELDPLTAKLAQALYPSAKVKNAGFEDFDIPSGYFDVVIGNPPFGSEPIRDSQRSAYSGFSIHNYFLAKAIDKLRPGGILQVVVSHNFLDAQDGRARAWIGERANLIGAVRLPNTAFKENAGTVVVTDILVFQKKGEGASVAPDLGAWQDVVDQTNLNEKTGESAVHKVNQLLASRPDLILGKPSAAGTMRKANEYTVQPTGELKKQLAGWVQTLPEGVYQPVERGPERNAADVVVPDGIKVGSFFVDPSGRIMTRGEDLLGERTANAWTPPSEMAAKRVRGMIELRDTLRQQMRLERLHESTDQEIEANRALLNKQYDAFEKAYGHLNSQTNRRLFLDDPEVALLQALEFDYDRGVSKAAAEKDGSEERAPSAAKADIFTRRVVFPPQDMLAVSSAKDALLASLNFKGRVDLDYMQSVYDKGADAIVAELGDVVFNDPQAGLVMADEYLSGDVKTKLVEAEAAAKDNPALRRNVEALRKVIPADKKPSEITVSLGAQFVPTELYKDFFKLITGGAIELNYLKATGQWVMDVKGGLDPALNTGKFGTADLSAADLFQLTMLGKGAVVKKVVKNSDGSTTTILLEKETEAARAKQEAIKAEWKSWIWKDAERADRLAAIYNDKMNRVVVRKFDGSHLTFPGMNPAIQLLPHQKNGVWRGLQTFQTLYDHVVGAGKTFEMATLAMEMRRLGIARKPVFVVPNHLTLQWRSEFTRLYPTSNVLAATPEDFGKGNREKLFSKIVTGDWDAVIIGHSSLKKIGLPAETEAAILQEQVDEISAAIEDMKRSRGDRNIVGDMERIRKTLEGKLKDKAARVGERDKVLTFDELGLDALFVDEMHEFKNLTYNSTMDRVPGMGNPAGSDKSFDLFVKVRWLFDTFGKKAPLITATGTPVSNSLVEMFNMQRFMQYPTMKEAGVHVFDSWARQFGSVESVYEVAPSGTGFRQSSRFAKFTNLPALMAQYNTFADVITLDDLKAQEEARGKRFPVPKLLGGRPQIVVAERSPQVAAFMGVPRVQTAEGGALQFTAQVGEHAPEFKQDDKGKWVAKVGDLTLPAADTLEDARLRVVEKALTPVVSVEPGSILGQFANLRRLTKESKGKINALSLTGQANKAGLDYRLIDASAPDFKGSKINMAVDNAMKVYHQWAADKGTQLIFCDLSIPLSARADLGSRPMRVYVRGQDGGLAHKRGTLHALEGHETLPYIVTDQGAKDSRQFDLYDAATGILLQAGFKTKADAREKAHALLTDPAKRQKWIEAREAAGDIEQDQIDEYNDLNEIDAEESPSITREDIAGMSGAAKFSVYDDIKAKLIARGVPEREIAFIHDYSTPTAKDKLFKAVNKGDVRFLLGSTPKMGAGTNVQKLLVGLHHIDAPWRPSDLEQREGRIIRRGNTLYERDPDGFEVAIYRYATAQTYDTRRWQILEHKARGIEQLRNYDGTLNEIEDIAGEAANSADMKAAASGDPLILEETRLRNEVRRLEQLEAAHADNVVAMGRRAQSLQQDADKWLPQRLAELQKIASTLAKNPVAKDGFPHLRVNGQAVKEKDGATAALQRAINDVVTGAEGTAKAIVFRGVEFSLLNGPFAITLEIPELHGNLGSWARNETISPSGMLTRLANYASRIDGHIEDTKAKIELAKQQAADLRGQAKAPWGEGQALAQAREDYRRVQRQLIAKGPAVPEDQKAALRKALEAQKQALKDAGLGDALAEFLGGAGGADATKFQARGGYTGPHEAGIEDHANASQGAGSTPIGGSADRGRAAHPVQGERTAGVGSDVLSAQASGAAGADGEAGRASSKGAEATGVNLGDGIKANPTETDLRNIRALNHAVADHLQRQGQPTGGGALGFVAGDVPGDGPLRQVAAAFRARIQWFALAPQLTPEQRRIFGFFNGTNFGGIQYIRATGVDRPHLAILGHELVHQLKRDDPALYDEFVDAVTPFVDVALYESKFRKSAVARDVQTAEGQQEEFMAEVGADAFMEPAFWEALGRKSTNLLGRVLEIAKRLVAQVKRALGYSSQTKQYLRDFDAVVQIAAGVFARYQAGKGASDSLKFQAKDDDPASPAGIAQKVRNDLIQFFGNKGEGDSKSLTTFGWYSRTLSSQYHKALKDRHFGKVFGYVNAMQNEVSLTSIRPAELAPGFLPRVDDVKSAARQVLQGKKANPAMDGAIQALMEGTLQVPDNVMAGKVWDEAELRGRFKLDDTGIALYRQARAAINASLGEVAAAEAYAMAQGMVPKSIRRAIIDAPQQAEALLMAELTRQIKVVSSLLRAAKKADDGQQVGEQEAARHRLEETRRKVEQVFTTAKNLQEAGYVPLMRFGKFTVNAVEIDPNTGAVVRDDEGKPATLYFGKFETEGEAIARRNELQAKFKDRDDIRITAGQQSQQGHELFAGISPETLALFGEVVGAGDVTRKYYQEALTERSALKRRLERAGTYGFSDDLPRVLSTFITSNGRFAAQRYYLRDLNNAIKWIPKEKGDVKDEAIALKAFVMNPTDAAAGVSSALFAWFLGGSVAAAVVNLTQPVMMTTPYLAQHGGLAKASAVVTKAIPRAMGKAEIADKGLRDALKRASQEGIVDAQEIFHLYSIGAQGVATGLVNTLAKIPGAGKAIKGSAESWRARTQAFMTLWGSMFAVAEKFNRRVTFIAAWDLAKANGRDDAYAFAVRAVNETQGIYNKANRPNWARPAVGRVMLTFKQFSIMYLELLNRMWKHGGPEGKLAVGVLLSVLMLASGFEGLPFMSDLDDLIDTAGQWFGFDTNMRRNKRRLAHEILGKGLGDLFLHGVSSQLPLDFSGRLGLGNLIPGSGVFKKSNDGTQTARSAIEVVGPTAGMVMQMFDAYDALTDGNAGKAAQNLAPKAIKDALAAADMAKKGHASDAAGRKTVDTDMSDAVIKAVGFNPTKVAEDSRLKMPIYQDIGLHKNTESSIVDRWARGIVDSDAAAVEKAQKELETWNRDNPSMPIAISASQIRGRARALSTASRVALAKKAPRELRGHVGLELMDE